MLMMNKTYNILNTISLFSVFIILVYAYWARVDMLPLVSIFNYISIFSLASIILILPSFLAFYKSGEKKWFNSSDFYTIILLISLAFIGIFIARLFTGVTYVFCQ